MFARQKAYLTLAKLVLHSSSALELPTLGPTLGCGADLRANCQGLPLLASLDRV